MQPSPGAAESERILAGEGCAMFERSEFAPAAKIRVDEGSLRSKPATGVAFFCLLFFGDAKKVSGRAAMKRKVKRYRSKYKNAVYFIFKVNRFITQFST